MSQRNVTKQKSIGYWLKHADEAITRHVDRVLSDNDFTRSHWQVLNIVYQARAITRSGVFNTLADLHRLTPVGRDPREVRRGREDG